MRDIRHIVIHCSASPNGNANVTRDVIDSWHKAKGWRMVGYHYVIEIDGSIVVGRREVDMGAHVQGSNEHSIGICVIGTSAFMLEQWQSLRALSRELALRYPAAQFLGHRDFSPDKDGDGVIEPWEFLKVCPGFSVKDWILSGMDPMWNPSHLYAPA